jgi:hypothetical protein
MDRSPSHVRAGLHAVDHQSTSAPVGPGADTTMLEHGPRQHARAKGVFSSLRSLKRRVDNGTGNDTMEVLRAEVLLLREENAHLRIKLERTPEVGDVVAQLRSLASDSDCREETGDHTWHLLTETVIARDALVDLCRRTQEAMVALESRLQEVMPPSPAVGDGVTTGNASGERTLPALHSVSADNGAVQSTMQQPARAQGVRQGGQHQ